jgi:HEAT repeat protein
MRELDNPLETERVIVRLGALVYLGKLRAVESTAHVTKLLLEDPRSEVRATAAVVLRELCATEAVGSLVEATSDQNAGVRRRAIEALAKLAHNDQDVALTIQDALVDPSSLVRAAAVDALAEIGYTNADVAADVRTRLNDPDRRVRQAAKRALHRLAP